MLRASSRSATLVKPLCRLQSTQAAQAPKYTSPEPANIAQFQQSGIPGFLSSKGLQNAYYARSQLYSEKLGQELTKHQLGFTENLDNLITQHSRSSTKRAIHDYASLLHNVNFAYSILGKARGSVTEIPPQQGVSSLVATPDLSLTVDNAPSGALLPEINRYFGSPVEFKTLLLNSASAINGDGFTWLVARRAMELASNGTKYDALFILNTYNAGTPFGNDHAGQVSRFETQDPRNEEHTKGLSTPIMSFFKARQAMVGDKMYTPLLCVDASPKAYLEDYGVYGKKAYLEQWWRSVDWEAVEKNLPEPSVRY